MDFNYRKSQFFSRFCHDYVRSHCMQDIRHEIFWVERIPFIFISSLFPLSIPFPRDIFLIKRAKIRVAAWNVFFGNFTAFRKILEDYHCASIKFYCTLQKCLKIWRSRYYKNFIVLNVDYSQLYLEGCFITSS